MKRGQADKSWGGTGEALVVAGVTIALIIIVLYVLKKKLGLP